MSPEKLKPLPLPPDEKSLDLKRSSPRLTYREQVRRIILDDTGDFRPENENAASEYRFELLDSSTLTPEITHNIANAFRETFNNAFPEFVVCQPCGQQKSASEVYGVESGSFIPLYIMDQLQKLPPCPDCTNPMQLFHDPETTEVKLTEKFKKDAHVVLITDSDERIVGGTFGYKRSLEEVFRNEWGHKFLYTRDPDPRFRRDESFFIEAMMPVLEGVLSKNGKKPMELTPQSDIYCWNCIFLRPRMQGDKALLQLANQFFRGLPDEYKNLGVLAETLDDADHERFIKLVKLLGFQETRGVLGGDYLMLSGDFGHIIDSFYRYFQMFIK